MRVLVTGFEPFGGEPTNPSWEAASRLPEVIDGHEIVAVRLPVEYDRGVRELAEAIGELRPEAVISLGQAAGRGAITPELLAVNMANAAAPDGSGAQFGGERLIGFGAELYISSLNIRAGIAAMNEVGAPAVESRNAGGYVCNAVMFAALCMADGCAGEATSDDTTAIWSGTQKTMKDVAAQEFAGKMRCGFVHLPLTPEQSARRGKGEPSMELERMIKGICAYIPAAVQNK